MTAPLVALVQSSTVRFRRGIFVAWNIFGMLDLVVAVSLGILVSRSSLGLLAGTSSSAAMALFPLSLVPTFLVPLSFILHLVGLSHVRKQ